MISCVAQPVFKDAIAERKLKNTKKINKSQIVRQLTGKNLFTKEEKQVYSIHEGHKGVRSHVLCDLLLFHRKLPPMK